MNIFSLPYLPNIAWFQHALQFNQITIDGFEHYQKQTFRNRCHILSANGVQTLIIPVKYSNSEKTHYNKLQPDNTVFWQRQHLQSLAAAYGKSAFFNFYKPYFENIYNQKINSVFEFNLDLTKLILKLLNSDLKIHLTNQYIEPNTSINDFRNYFNAKKYKQEPLLINKQYYQVFSEKFSFEPNLSIVDLLFNRGNEALEFLIK